MDNPQPGRSFGRRLAQLVVGVAFAYAYADVMSRGALTRHVARIAAGMRSSWVPADTVDLSPAELAALHTEARRITREAARRDGRQ